jgi:glycine cleavage system H protein
MSQIRYTSSHEWVRLEADGSVTVGITDHAQGLLGDMVYVDLPDVDEEVEAEGDCAVVESVKAASDVYAPLDGTILAVNEALEDAPELTNSSPMDEGWLFKMTPANADDFDKLLDEAAYQAVVDAEDH